MSTGERAVDLTLSLCVLVSAGVTARAAWLARDGAQILACVAALHAAVAVLLAVRRRARVGPTLRSFLVSAPSVAAGAVAYKVAPAPAEWPFVAVALFVAGAAIGIASLSTLGRSFAVFPALRQVVVRGPYRCVRHPVYAGELLLVAATALACDSPGLGAAVLTGTFACLVPRIIEEERVLSGCAEYAAYRDRVRARLVPGVW